MCSYNVWDSDWAQAALAVLILGAAAVITHFFARAMYIACSKCGTLNARRRAQCRRCGHPLRPVMPLKN